MGFNIPVAFVEHSPAEISCLEIKEQTTEWLKVGNFVKLETVSKDYRESKSKLLNGQWELECFHDGVAAYFDLILGETGGDDKPDHNPVPMTALEQVQKWAKTYPQSPSAHIAVAHAYRYYAFAYRGQGYESTVSQENWQKFGEYTRLSADYLIEHADVAKADPRWYTSMIKTGTGLSWSPKVMSEILTEGMNRYPDYFPLYYFFAQHLLPRWGGSREALDAFAIWVSDHTQEQFGTGAYALIYMNVIEKDHEFSLATFIGGLGRSLGNVGASDIKWPRLRQSLIDLVARYPDPENLNFFAVLACQAKDASTVSSMIEKMKDQIIGRFWLDNDPTEYNYCKMGAQEMLAEMIQSPKDK